MSTLHTVNKSSFTHNTLKSCIAVSASTDGILLLEDGVFGVLESAPDSEALRSLALQGIKIYALVNDVQARALEEKVSSHIQLIGYEEFVALTLHFNCIQSWY